MRAMEIECGQAFWSAGSRDRFLVLGLQWNRRKGGSGRVLGQFLDILDGDTVWIPEIDDPAARVGTFIDGRW